MNLEERKKILRQLADEMLPFAKMNLERDGYLMPVVFAIFGDGQYSVIGVKFANQSEKETAYREIGFLMRRKLGAWGAVLVNDTWFYDVTKEKPVSSHPARQEGIARAMITHGWTEVQYFPYHRDGKMIAWQTPGPVFADNDVCNYIFPAFEEGVH